MKTRLTLPLLIVPVLLVVLSVCQKSTEPEPEQLYIDLTGSWELTTTIEANTFGMPNGETNTEMLYLRDSSGDLTIINFGGDWGHGQSDSKSLQFTGMETSDDFDGPATLVTQGDGAVSENNISGTFVTSVYISKAVEGNEPDGTITSGFVMARVEETGCYGRAVFGDPKDSPYVLPYPVGKAYPVYQSYCWRTGGHRDQLAYDFTIPIGDTVVAARAGVVRQIKQDSPDNGEGAGQHNCVFIEHDDGTTAFYAHLKQNSVVVRVNDRVEAGEYFALSGNSGYSGEPHLHFGVYQAYPATEGVDVPINFKNADGPLDSLGGLIRYEVYKALPY